jgi:cell division protein FtsW
MASAVADLPYSPTRSRLDTGWEGPALLALTLIALSAGLVSVWGASAVKAEAQGLAHYDYVVSQLIGGAAGLLALVAVANIDYRRWRLLAWPLMIATIAALFVILLPGTDAITIAANGAKRWLRLGPVSIQPSEFAKLTLITWTAALAVKKQERLRSLTKGLLPFLLVWFITAGLVALEPSMSAAMLIVLLAGLVVFAAGARLGHFIALGLVGLPILITRIGGFAYQMDRIAAFRDMSSDPAGISYQINQALIAIGSGGLLGVGFGRGQQKFGFLPEPHNDFIFAMIAEEWGFAGIVLLVALFSAIALIGYRIARQAPDLFGFLLAIGLTNLIALQAFLHMGVNLALLPTTGVTLPFFSYGRSSLLVSLIAVGLLMNIARHAGRRME